VDGALLILIKRGNKIRPLFLKKVLYQFLEEATIYNTHIMSTILISGANKGNPLDI
jgi:hypothetical protein